MKRFDRLKTIQMVILIVLTCIALFMIIRDVDLYRLIASDPHVRRICIILWIALGISFVFLFYDFNSYTFSQIGQFEKVENCILKQYETCLHMSRKKLLGLVVKDKTMMVLFFIVVVLVIGTSICFNLGV